MNAWASTLNRKLKIHDSLLYLNQTVPGRYDIYRKSGLGCEHPYFICSLTDSWTPQGRPTEWGIEVVINRLKAHDLWKDGNVMDEIEAGMDREKASKDRARKNTIESFLYDFRSQFRKATDGINTSTLEKVDRRRKEDKNGYL